MDELARPVSRGESKSFGEPVQIATFACGSTRLTGGFIVAFMGIFPGGEGPLMGARQPNLHAHIDGLCREEDELLAIAEHERTAEHHQRLHAISSELDSVFERLRERVRR